MRPRAFSRRAALAAAAFAVLTALPFLGNAYHMDEPFFLAIARQILVDPLRPMGFVMYRFFELRPAAPADYLTLAPYWLAPILRAFGDRETAMRLLCLPLDAIAALALYDLAAAFLDAPLLPTLIVLAGPGYFINVSHLMAEKWVAAAGFAGLAFLVRAGRRESLALYALSAGLLSLAIMFKLSGGLFLLTALAYGWSRGLRARRLALYAAAAGLPAAAFHGWGLANGSWAPGGLWGELLAGSGMPWLGWTHRLRTLGSEIGACAGATAVWPFLGVDKNRIRGFLVAAAAASAAAALLFLPGFDWTDVGWGERLSGVILTAGTLLLILRVGVLERAKIPGRELWFPWFGLGLALEACVHGNITTRFVMLALPPAVLAAAALLEKTLSAGARARVYAASLACTALLTFGLAEVDARYAGAQRDFARLIEADYLSKGRKVFYSGHWGFEYYLRRAGAVGLTASAGGWEQVRAGDVVVFPLNNTMVFPPPRRIGARVKTVFVDDAIPLRLIPSSDVHSAFYTSAGGFLPFTFGREPLDAFTIVEKL